VLKALNGDVDKINSLRDDDMAYLMSMNTKELHKLCGRLKEDRFLAVYVFSNTQNDRVLTSATQSHSPRDQRRPAATTKPNLLLH
jgi:hypothetical protein